MVVIGCRVWIIEYVSELVFHNSASRLDADGSEQGGRKEIRQAFKPGIS